MAIEVQNISYGTSYSTEEVHFTGGLRGLPTDQGWALFPTSEKEDSTVLVFKSVEAHSNFVRDECGAIFVGTCMKYRTGSNAPPMDVWESGARDPDNGLNASDSWGAVAYQARDAGDTEYADCASYVSVCLRVAGLRLRDVSNHYHDQLKWALAEKRKSAIWFSNAALIELYADFHSLVAELSSARDYLAKIAAIHAGAPKAVESLARLMAWAEKPANQTSLGEPLITSLFADLGSVENPGWLRRLGAIRNEMLHRVPMGANKVVSGLVLEEVPTSYGPIKTIRLAEPLRERALVNQTLDPLVELSQISKQMEQLSRAAWRSAKYPAKIREFVGKPAT